MTSKDRTLSLLVIQVLLIAAAIYVGVAEGAFPGASPFGRAAIVVVCVAASFLAGEVSRLRLHFGALLKALEAGAVTTAPRDDRAAIDVLVAALDSANGDVRAKAHRNLVKITGQDFPPESARWRAWWAPIRDGFVRPPSNGA